LGLRAGWVRSCGVSPSLGFWAKVFERFGLGPDFGFWSGRLERQIQGSLRSACGLGRDDVLLVLFGLLKAKARREAGLGLIVAGWGKLFCNFMLLILRVVRGFLA